MADHVLAWLSNNALQSALSVAALFLIPIAKRYASLLKDESVRRVVQSIILEVEERANQASTKVPGQRKLDIAITNILDKVPGIDRDEADRLVHQELPKVRPVMRDFATATLSAALSPSQPATT